MSDKDKDTSTQLHYIKILLGLILGVLVAIGLKYFGHI